MSEPRSSGSIQLCLGLLYSPAALHFVRSKGAQEREKKKEGSAFSPLCTSHSHTGIPKASANELGRKVLGESGAGRGEKEKKKFD